MKILRGSLGLLLVAVPGLLFAAAAQEEPLTASISAGQASMHQAPELREMVAKGLLPPLQERLPEEPRVVAPVEGLIGTYGGNLRIGSFSDWYGIISPVHNPVTLTKQSQDLAEVIPDVAKGWQLGDGGRTTTFSLRRGTKWSDGAPFTTEDIAFWYEDVLTNEALTPNINAKYYRGGQLMISEVLSPESFSFKFAEPYPAVVEFFGTWGGLREDQVYYPKHYLQQFHPAYTAQETIDSQMKSEGFESWTDYFMNRASRYNPEKPGLAAYLPLDWDNVQVQRWKRNPYHFRVDPEGNQLPYIDTMTLHMLADTNAVLLKVLAGDLDSTGVGYAGPANYDLLQEGRAKGGYRIVSGSWMNNVQAVRMNFFGDDELKNRLYQDVRFRIALSIALDREEMNELIYNGQYFVSGPKPASPFDEMGGDMWDQHIEYDPARANELFDEVGLGNRDRDGFRTRPDGSELVFRLDVWAVDEDRIAMAELEKKFWADVGLKVVLNNEDSSLWRQRALAGKHDLSTGGYHWGGGPVPPVLNRNVWEPPQGPWIEWLNSNGERGLEPPQDAKRLRELQELALGAQSRDDYNRHIMDAYRIHVDNFWIIGALLQSQVVQYRMINSKLRNIPPAFLDADVIAHEPYAWFYAD